MIKLITIILITFTFSTISAEETVCPVTGKAPWDKMKESDFSKEKVIVQLDKLKKYFSGNEVVAEEFIYQSMLVIEGGALREGVKYWKKHPKNSKHSKKLFCEFMAKKAYLVH